MTSSALRRLEPAALALGAALASALVVLVAYRTGPFIPLALGMALCAGVLAITRPMVSLCLAVAVVPLELFPLHVGIPGVAGITPTEAMFGLTGIGWAIRRILRGQAPFTPSPLGKPFTLLLLAVVPGLLIAADNSAVIKTLVMWTLFLLVYQMVVAEATPESVRGLLVVLGLSGATVSVIAILASGGQPQELVGGGAVATNRAIGSFLDPNTLASFLAVAIPGSLVVSLQGPGLLRPVGVVTFALNFVGLALSLSRGGLLAALGAIVVLLAWPPVRRSAAVAGVTIALLAVFNAFPLGQVEQVDRVLGRIGSISSSPQSQANQRLKLWATTPQIVADHPLFGIGIRQYPVVAPRYGLIEASGVTFEHAHNIPLTIAAELGLLGLVLLAWWAVALVRTLMRACRRNVGANLGLAFAVAGAMVSLGLQGMVDDALGNNVIAAVTCVLAGCAVVMSRAAGPVFAPRSRPAAPTGEERRPALAAGRLA